MEGSYEQEIKEEELHYLQKTLFTLSARHDERVEAREGLLNTTRAGVTCPLFLLGAGEELGERMRLFLRRMSGKGSGVEMNQKSMSLR